MDKTRLDQQFDRRLSKMEKNIDYESGRVPLENYEKLDFQKNIYYENAVLDAKIFCCFEKLKPTPENNYNQTKGPWIVFKVNDILEGDPEGNICPGAIILAKWNNSLKKYLKYVYSENPREEYNKIKLICDYSPMDYFTIWQEIK